MPSLGESSGYKPPAALAEACKVSLDRFTSSLYDSCNNSNQPSLQAQPFRQSDSSFIMERQGSVTSVSHVHHGRHRFTTPDNLTLSYLVRGNGPLLVVHGPGWGMGSRYLHLGLAPLEEYFTLLYVDPRGNGRSSRPKDVSQMGSSDMANDLEQLRLHIGVEKMSFLAHSNGGSVVLMYAERFPQHVDKTILASSRLIGYCKRLFTDPNDPELNELPSGGAVKGLLGINPKDDEQFGQYLREFIPTYFYDPMNTLPDMLQALAANPCCWCLEHNLKCDAAAGKGAIEDLGKVTAKTLIVTGRQDIIGPLEESNAMKEGIGGNAKLVVFEECGHFPWLERWEDFRDLVLDFMEDKGISGMEQSHKWAPKAEDRPIGAKVDASPAERPTHMVIEGSSIRLEPLHSAHAKDLYECIGGMERAALWDYMPDGPFSSFHEFQIYITFRSRSPDPLFFAVIDKRTKKAIGHVSFLRIDTSNRCIEVGFIMFSNLLQKTTAATECMYLMACVVFEELGYRRYEWKCNDLNAPSKRSAERLGFTFEGVFRQHMITKGRNRDTAWFSMLDHEWDRVKRGFEAWLDERNFDKEGRQRATLQSLRNAYDVEIDRYSEIGSS